MTNFSQTGTLVQVAEVVQQVLRLADTDVLIEAWASPDSPAIAIEDAVSEVPPPSPPPPPVYVLIRTSSVLDLICSSTLLMNSACSVPFLGKATAFSKAAEALSDFDLVCLGGGGGFPNGWRTSVLGSWNGSEKF